MDKWQLKFRFDLALVEFEAHEHETDHFSRPLESYTDRDLRRMLQVNCVRVLTYMIKNKVLHVRHNAEIKRALPYLSELQQMQAAAWKRAEEKIEKWVQS